jgi:hypothetical protein
MALLAACIVTYAGTVKVAQDWRDAKAGEHSCKLDRKHPVRVKVDRSEYPGNWRHIVDARNGRNTGPDGVTVIDTGQRWPRVLEINRHGAAKRRVAAFRMAGVPTRPGKARDEYPPAFLRESDAADIRLVDRDANSSQGTSMGNQLRCWPDGQPVVLVGVP